MEPGRQAYGLRVGGDVGERVDVAQHVGQVVEVVVAARRIAVGREQPRARAGDVVARARRPAHDEPGGRQMMRLHATGLPRKVGRSGRRLCDDRPVLLPDVPPTAGRIAFWLAVAVGVSRPSRLVALAWCRPGSSGPRAAATTIGLSLAIVVAINLLALVESALAAYFCSGDTRRAKWAFVVVAFLGLLNLVPTVRRFALWLLRRRSVRLSVED